MNALTSDNKKETDRLYEKLNKLDWTCEYNAERVRTSLSKIFELEKLVKTLFINRHRNISHAIHLLM